MGAVARLGSAAFHHGGWTGAAAFSPDGKRVLSLSFQLVCVWDAATGQMLAEFSRPDGTGSWVGGAISADGQSVCLVHDDGIARVFDLASRQESRQFSLNGELPRQQRTLHVAFAPDGQTLAAQETDDGIRLWDVATGTRGHLFQTGGKLIRAFALAAAAKTAATLDEDGTARLWSTATGQEMSRFACTGRDVALFALSADGARLATVCQTAEKHTAGDTSYTTFITDSFVQVWDAAKGAIDRQIKAHPKGVGSVSFAPDGQLWTGGYGLDPFVRRWDVKTGRKLQELPRQANAVTTMALSADGKSLVTDTNGTLRLWNAESFKEKLPFDAHRAAVCKVVLAADGHALTAGGDGSVREWELATGKPLAKFEVQPAYIADLARSKDGRRLAVLGHSPPNPEICVLDSAGKLLRTLKGKDKTIGGLAFSPDGSLLAAADYGGRVFLWDVETGRELRTLKAAGERGSDLLAFSADGKRLLGASIDDPFCIWELASGNARNRGIPSSWA